MRKLRRRDMLSIFASAGAMAALGLRASAARAHLAVESADPPRPGPSVDVCKDPYGPYVHEMIAHCQKFAPSQSKVMGPAALEAHIRATLAKGQTYGITFRGPVRTLIELSFLYGHDFDTDPQYPWIAAHLRREGPEMERAEAIYEGILAYQAAVSSWDERAALARFLVRSPDLAITSTDLVGESAALMTSLFPEKAAYVGEPALRSLAEAALVEAEVHSLAHPEGRALMSALVFALGHGCARDPTLPMVREHLDVISRLPPAEGLAHARAQVLTWSLRSFG